MDNQDDRPDSDRDPRKPPRREPQFGDFPDYDNYEEPDRDNDYTSAFREEEFEEELAADRTPDDAPNEDYDDDAIPLQEWPEPAPAEGVVTGTRRPEVDELWDDEEFASPEEADNLLWGDDEEDVLRERDPQDRMPDTRNAEEEEEEDTWEYNDERSYPNDPPGALHRWPLGLIAVAILALLLVVAGGYGVVQQRAATREEIRDLQAALATAASPAEVLASRDALLQVQQRNLELQDSLDNLALENRRLADTVAGLESQLEAQRQAVAKPAAPVKQAVATRSSVPEPAKSPSAVNRTAANDTWFVNFGSYSQRTAAERWAGKLQPTSGTVVITTASKDGQTFYRVRVVELTNREAAEKVAQQLQREHDLSKLWVGKQ